MTEQISDPFTVFHIRLSTGHSLHMMRVKTGCRMEQRFLQSVEALWKLLAILTPIALRLLFIRQAAQQSEEIPAVEVVSQEVISIVVHLDPRHREMVTAKQLWHGIARLGGYLDRSCDGPPG